VLSGRLAVAAGAGAREPDDIGRGGTVGVLGVLRGERCAATVVAATSAEVRAPLGRRPFRGRAPARVCSMQCIALAMVVENHCNRGMVHD
jgi:hypothetical protein